MTPLVTVKPVVEPSPVAVLLTLAATILLVWIFFNEVAEVSYNKNKSSLAALSASSVCDVMTPVDKKSATSLAIPKNITNTVSPVVGAVENTIEYHHQINYNPVYWLLYYTSNWH